MASKITMIQRIICHQRDFSALGQRLPRHHAEFLVLASQPALRRARSRS
jgi:hypothetical protein